MCSRGLSSRVVRAGGGLLQASPGDDKGSQAERAGLQLPGSWACLALSLSELGPKHPIIK